MTDETPSPEVPVRMATKGLGWSGREEARKVAPPPMGPGMIKPEFERFGSVDVDDALDVDSLGDPMVDIPDDQEVDASKLFGDTRVFEVLDALDRELVALEVVKRRVREIASL